ncbi:MAG: class I SAM-dependent methyltransferase [Chloroflexota bacterium]
MTPRNLLTTMQTGIRTRLSSGHEKIKVLLVGSASEQSAALVCSTLEEWFAHHWYLTVLDRCRTPLNRIREHLGSEINVVQGDLSEYRPPGEEFDLIIGDCILEFNTAENRGRMLENISALLSETGVGVLRERTGIVSHAMEIRQESEHLVQKARDHLAANHLPLARSELELIRSKSYRFLLQILDSHNAYESRDALERDLSMYLSIIDRQIFDNVSRELVYHYYILRKRARISGKALRS